VPRKIFGEQEAAELLRAAARMQEELGKDSYSAGVTLEELRRIASEAGIEPKYLDRALEQAQSAPRERSLLNLVEETEHVLDGEVPMGDVDLVAEALRRQGSVQMAQQLGRTVAAQVVKAPMVARVQLSSRNGRTRLTVRSVPLLAYFLGLHAPLIAACVAGPLVGSHNPVGGVLASAGLVLGGMLAFTGLARVGKRRARQMGERLAEELGSLVQPTEVLPLSPGEAGHLDEQA
jgi:hypothetical protein